MSLRTGCYDWNLFGLEIRFLPLLCVCHFVHVDPARLARLVLEQRSIGDLGYVVCRAVDRGMEDDVMQDHVRLKH